MKKTNFGFTTHAVPDAVKIVPSRAGWMKRSTFVIAIVALSFSSFGPALANHDSFGGVDQDKVDICHQEGNGTLNPSPQVNVNSIISAHQTHANDIIPPFHYDGGTSFAGKNWNAVGQDKYNNGACDGDGIIPADPETAHLTLVKALAGDDTTDVETDWTLEADGDSSIIGVTGDAEITNAEIIVDDGSYTLNESGPTTGYTSSDWVCEDDGNAMVVTNGNTVQISADQEVTCTITNTFDDGDDQGGDTSTLTLVKALDGDDTTDVETDWTLSASGATNISGTTGQAAITAASVTSGSYDLSESGPTLGYTPSDWVCMLQVDSVPVSANMTDGDTVVLTKNQNVTCTITNTFDDSTPRTFSISGKIYNDNNEENGTFNEGEDGLVGWRAYVDLGEGNNEFDEGENTDLSDADGNYTITGLAAGCYTLREVLENNWDQTEPTEVDDFEYTNVSVGGAICPPIQVSFLDSVKGLFIHTAEAAVVAPPITYNFGNVAQSGGSSGGGGHRGGGSSNNDDGGQILGDSTSIPYIAPTPQVLGAATLPVTGSSLNYMWALLGVLAMLAIPAVISRKIALKN